MIYSFIFVIAADINQAQKVKAEVAVEESRDTDVAIETIAPSAGSEFVQDVAAQVRLWEIVKERHNLSTGGCFPVTAFDFFSMVLRRECCMLQVMCCMLQVECCMLQVVCCMLQVVCCMLQVECCMLQVVCCMLQVVCCMLQVGVSLPNVKIDPEQHPHVYGAVVADMILTVRLTKFTASTK